MNEPTIPLKHAELLHVAMCTVIDVIEKRTDYPTANIQQVIAGYTTSRDKYLIGQGFTKGQIKLFTEAAIEALVSWLEERHLKASELDADFNRWTSELMED